MGTNREQRLFRNKTGFWETGERGSGSPPLAVSIARIFGLSVGRVISTSENLLGSGNKHQPQKLCTSVPLFWGTSNSGGYYLNGTINGTIFRSPVWPWGINRALSTWHFSEQRRAAGGQPRRFLELVWHMHPSIQHKVGQRDECSTLCRLLAPLLAPFLAHDLQGYLLGSLPILLLALTLLQWAEL